MVLLIGNYPLDRQQSMQRFARMMLQGLTAAGIPARLIAPQPLLGRISLGEFSRKWLAYVDKFLLFPHDLKKKSLGASLIHICDHSNAPYVTAGKVPTVVTCHDLLAVRGALDEETDCPASPTGKFLQRWILRGLSRASVVVCDSDTTRSDAERLLDTKCAKPQLRTVRLAADQRYRREPLLAMRAKLAHFSRLDLTQPFVLHVGSNLRRKNREAVLRIFARVRERWPGQLVFAGDALSAQLSALASQLGIAERIVEIIGPPNEELNALYNCARVLLYPSRFEGFGWPIIEAQSCGCPVVCSDAGPMPEVAGAGALIRPHEDEAGFAEDLLRLLDPVEHERWSAKSLENARRFSVSAMIQQYLEVYRSLAPGL